VRRRGRRDRLAGPQSGPAPRDGAGPVASRGRGGETTTGSSGRRLRTGVWRRPPSPPPPAADGGGRADRPGRTRPYRASCRTTRGTGARGVRPGREPGPRRVPRLVPRLLV